MTDDEAQSAIIYLFQNGLVQEVAEAFAKAQADLNAEIEWEWECAYEGGVHAPDGVGWEPFGVDVGGVLWRRRVLVVRGDE